MEKRFQREEPVQRYGGAGVGGRGGQAGHVKNFEETGARAGRGRLVRRPPQCSF